MQLKVEMAMSLLEALKLLAKESSTTTLRDWLRRGRVSVNGCEVKKGNHPLQVGDEVVLGLKSKPPIEELKGVKIVYQDEHLVVIDKPAGLLSVATEREGERTAFAYLKDYFRPKQVEVVHRLDQDTSGLMLFALSSEGKEGLKSLFETHGITRSYTAIVEGHPQNDEGTWDAYLFEDQGYKVHVTPNPEKGRRAITHYMVIGKSKNCSRLSLNLETGRKNQIRVHAAHFGHPVVGDLKYGAKTHPIKRLFLHAHGLTFPHPITKKQMHFESPVPMIFDHVVKNQASRT